jgi:hypothetical protein
MTPHQAELLSREDWRFHAIDAVGTGLGMLATIETLAKRNLSFGLPSAPALYLSLARDAHDRRSSIDVNACFIDHAKPQGTWPEDHRLLFDFFELFIAEVIFSFTAIEAFVNESIPPSFTYSWKNSKEVKQLGRADIERLVQLDEKLKRVLPEAHNLNNPAGTKAWQGFKDLKTIRDRVVHMKSIDRRASGPEHQTLWALMLEKKQQDFAEIAYQLIGSYPALVDGRRWYQSYKRRSSPAHVRR